MGTLGGFPNPPATVRRRHKPADSPREPETAGRLIGGVARKARTPPRPLRSAWQSHAALTVLHLRDPDLI